ncbi:MAG: hypothetical protein LBB76_12430, partial [Azoarcus sp.]|nr:hypothetical protein [Azoarcus sp.]
AFSDGIKSVDPGIRVLIGSSAREPGVFFDETYYNGTADFFDLHNHHNHSKTADLGVFAASIKTQEHNFNIHEKASWLTERGYVMEWDEWKSPAAPTTWYANGWQDAELEQARFLVRTYVSGFAAGYDRVFFFGWCELFEAAARGTWGIVHDDLSPRPAYVALALLTRHLAGAAVRSIEQHGEGRTVYFKKNNDNKWVAVTWGGGAAWNRLGTGVEIRDIFGKTLSIPEASGMTAPLLLSEIDASAANAGVPVGLPSETLRGRESSLRLAVTSLRIDGEEHVFSPSNGVDVPIGEGSTVEIVARPYTTGNTLATGVLGECAAGSGLVAQRPSAQIVNGELVCSFTAQPLRDRSYIMLRATKNGHSDVVRVALKADSATLVASPFLVNGQCPTWVPYKGSNVDPLVITEISAAPSCPWIKVESTILNGNQDSWVFPYVDFPTGTLAGKIGLRIQVEDAAVPAPLMIQLHESNGEAWLLSTTQLLKESEGVYSGLFSRATQPNWTPTRGNGVLNPEEVYKIMVGWSYTTSQAGAQHVYTIEEIELLSPNPVTGTPGTPSTPGTSGAPGASTGMALRDAIYLYRQPISGIATQASTLAAYNCDVFQMLLDVESGYTDVALLESEVASNAKVVYRDSIHATAPMFSYTLYAPMPVKTFTLGRFRGSVSTGGDIGTVTVFGYCFSTRADGKVLFHDGTGVCHLPSARAVSCPKVPEDDQW